MKHIATILLTAGTLSVSATVRTVNNNTPSPGQYTSLAAAAAAASPGDTLYISGSPYNYNGITIDKRLTLIGTGHKPQNDAPTVSRLDDITFSGNVDSAKFIGLDVNQINLNTTSTGIEIMRCKIRYRIMISSTTSKLKIESNYFEYAPVCLEADFYSPLADIYVRNNVLNGAVSNFYGYYGIQNVYFKNNLFLYAGNAFTGSNRYLQVSDNLFYGSNPQGVSNTIFSNNNSYAAGANPFQTGSGNTLNNNQEDVNPLLVNAAFGPYSYASDYTLQAGAPAKNAGSDGKDIGLTGGDGYFEKYGIPAIPQVRAFSITSPANGMIAPGGTLQISVKSTIRR